MEQNKKLRVGITHGDINGISYEVILKALADTRITELCTPIVYGSAKIASFYRKNIEIPPFRFFQIDNPEQADSEQINIINVVGEDTKIEPGHSSPEAGTAAVKALECAVADLKSGLIDVLVTAPINKKTVHGDDFDFPGHTEYLQDRLADGEEALMVMCNSLLRVALVTIHLPLAEVPAAISVEKILDRLALFNRSLIEDFGVHRPRIAVLSLNPHAGDGGILGDEEEKIIIPAIEQANADKILAFGPYAADGFFGSGAYRKFDGVLAMYHDQGLIPFKLIAGESGVNYTAGLPYVRTSPDHGTAYDIAGQGIADEQSMREAIYAAIDIYRKRANEAEATSNPLRKQHFDRGNDKYSSERHNFNND